MDVVIDRSMILMYEENDKRCVDEIEQAIKYYKGKVIKRFGFIFLKRETHDDWYVAGLREWFCYKIENSKTKNIHYELKLNSTSGKFKKKYKKYLSINLINPEEFDNI